LAEIQHFCQLHTNNIFLQSHGFVFPISLDFTSVVYSFFFFGRLTTETMRILRFAGAFAVVKRQGELKISEANVGAKPPECTSASL